MRRASCLLLVWAAFTQPPSFEVASIKPAQPIRNDLVRSGQMHLGVKIDKAQADFGGQSIQDLVARAYGVKDYQVSGPEQMYSRFDIVAKMPAGATEAQVPAMLRSLLAERFHLKVRRETKPFSVFVLVVGKNGPRLKPRTAEWKWVMGVPVRAMTMEEFARLLNSMTDLPVMDQTGIQGEYLIGIDAMRAGGSKHVHEMVRRYDAGQPPPNPADAASNPDQYGAASVAQSYGLKLEARKVPMPHIIIDRVDKNPIAN